MKKIVSVCAAAAVVVTASALYFTGGPVSAEDAAEAPAAIPGVKDVRDRFSYAMGLNFGLNLRQSKLDLNHDALMTGFKDGIAGQARMTPEEMQKVAMEFQEQVAANLAKGGEKNLAEGQAFLEKNKSAEGVKVTESGLQYKVLREGTGKSPTPADGVRVHYRGTLIDGTEFDSSYARNQPAEFGVGQVIAGWTEALQLMKEGSKFQFFIPANLAYGERGSPPTIGPNSVLIFEVELLEVLGQK